MVDTGSTEREQGSEAQAPEQETVQLEATRPALIHLSWSSL